MRVGIIGTGAISHKHAQAYRNIGFEVTVCTNKTAEKGRMFAAQYGAEFVPSYEAVCAHPRVDFVDVCTFPDFRVPIVELCASNRKHVQVQKPIATTLEAAHRMIEVTRDAGVQLGVVSQHRFDDSSLFLYKAIRDGRLGKILQADAYVKWWRSDEYYSRPIKGSWRTEGGGALINQGIHQVDLLLWLLGPVQEVVANWQLGARHKIESEDVVNALLRYRGGATGVIQASTAFWPGYTERVEIHGTKGTAVISGDRLTTWDVLPGDSGAAAPLMQDVASGASDPMAISLTPFERQFRDFARAIETSQPPTISGEDGLRALAFVLGVYESCRSGQKVVLS